MHFPSEFMLSYLGLAEGGIWAPKVNDGQQSVLVVKISTDAVKWIHRGVPVNLVIGHVSLEGVVVRVLALEIFDCQTNPLIPNLPQVEAWEIEGFDSLLTNDKFTVHFHNEQPFVSVLDATASLPVAEIRAYQEKRAAVKFHSTPVVTELSRRAQDIFSQAFSREPKAPVPQVELFRFPLTFSNSSWNSVVVPDAGQFNPDDANEGRSHEALIIHVLKPNFDGTVIASPKIPDGGVTRELCDVLAISKDAFLFEAKAFSVFEKPLDQTADRKAATVMKHFEKALGQLQGAIKRIVNGVELQADGSRGPLAITATQFRFMHGIVLVSNTSFDLPWLEIGKQLADAQQAPQVHYHFIQLAELQRMVAFARGESEALNQILLRRAKVIASSRDALVEMEYKPEVTRQLKLPAVGDDCLGIRFVWIGEDVGNSLVRFFSLVYHQFENRVFSGRLDFYHKLGKAGDSPGIGIGLAAQPLAGELDREWWLKFRADLFDAVAKAGLPQAAPKSEHLQALSEIRVKFPKLLMSVEFKDGFVVGANSGDL
jgi:hypothetical protein